MSKSHWSAQSSEGDSPAYSMLVRLWNGANETTGHSWRNLNLSMKGGVYLAISAGMRFAEDDFAKMEKHMRMDYWGLADPGGYAQSFYASACNKNNRSACIAFETFQEFKPFILQGRRLCCHAEFWQVPTSIERDDWWNAKPLTIERLWGTSIDSKSGIFNACWYDNPGQHQDGKPKRRYAFTQAHFRDMVKRNRLFLDKNDLVAYGQKQLAAEKEAKAKKKAK